MKSPIFCMFNKPGWEAPEKMRRASRAAFLSGASISIGGIWGGAAAFLAKSHQSPDSMPPSPMVGIPSASNVLFTASSIYA